MTHIGKWEIYLDKEILLQSINVITPKYQYKVHNSNRGPKHSFSFEINNFKHRICKTFFKNTLAINNRPIATVIAKKNQTGTIEKKKGVNMENNTK